MTRPDPARYPAGTRILVQAKVRSDGMLQLAHPNGGTYPGPVTHTSLLIVHGTVAEHEQLQAEVARLSAPEQGTDPTKSGEAGVGQTPAPKWLLAERDGLTKQVRALRTERDNLAAEVRSLRLELNRVVANRARLRQERDEARAEMKRLHDIGHGLFQALLTIYHQAGELLMGARAALATQAPQPTTEPTP
jgi:DNA repair exonuclease SbcCD ATPase subunit